MSFIFYLETAPSAIPIIFAANTAAFNEISALPATSTTVYTSGFVYETFGDAVHALRDAINSYLAPGLLPELWTGPREGASAGTREAIDIVDSVFRLRHIPAGVTYSERIGQLYGPTTFESVLYSNNNISDFYTPNIAGGTQLLRYRCYCSADSTTDVPDGFHIEINIIPEDAVNSDGTLNPSAISKVPHVSASATRGSPVIAPEKTPYRVSIVRSSNPTISADDLAKLDGIGINIPDPSESDPYTGYPHSTAPGGYTAGSYDFTDNGLAAMNTPGIDLLGSGFLTAWNVNKAQLNALANWLWVTTPSQIFQQIYGNPINAVIGLNVVPVAPSIDGGSNTIKFGVEDSQIAAPKITSQYASVDCGSLSIAPIYGSYMDYSPYSSAELFLPYCGGVPLDINDVVGKTISIKYQVDILSGACVAYIFINGHLHYQRSGCCAGTAPVTGSQLPNVISGVLSIVGSVAGAIGSMGASGASTAAKVASGIATGTDVASAATNALKRSISYSGTVSGWAGLLGAQKPYLILSLPNAAIPAGQQQLSGYPAWVGGQLSNFSGHTECANVHLNGLRATDEEMQEIRALLESGVIL